MNESNPELQLADDFVRYTDCHLFLTGKAGTGKTTFLLQVKSNTDKRLIVTAPTGVAAINAGGVTLHSFFQLPFGPYVPGSELCGSNNQRKFNKEKIKIIKSLDLLVVDEISMVRADLLDGVDMVLRRYRRSNRPFGGVQLLLIGDLHQLPPVVKEADWQLLRNYYESAYFFSSHALRQTALITIELRQIYRQSDHHFIELLNRVRDSRLDAASLQELNGRVRPGFAPADDEGFITLGTHNSRVDAINQARLAALRNKAHRFTAEIEGDFPEHSYPAPGMLELKAGAQVMFVRNDASRDKLFYNGKIGTITRIDGKAVCVKCPDDKEEILVEQASWENIKYTIDPQTREISENRLGKFVQYPLKLAWAITIHKSQGLTFDRAIIDAAAAFAHGQVYVALSRCRSFEGLVLTSPIPLQAVKSDPAVCEFMQKAAANPPSAQRLSVEKISHQQRLLLDCFDFERLRYRLKRLLGVLHGSERLITVSGVQDIRELESRGVQEICVIGENFKRQLGTLFAPGSLPQEDPVIIERIGKASAYFQEKIETILGHSLRLLRVESDNKEINQRFKDALNELNREIVLKMAAVKSCEGGFSSGRYLRAISEAEIDFTPGKERKSAQADYTVTDVAHPGLFQTLKDWRSKLAAREGLPAYRILHQSVLIQIAVNLPDSPAALGRIRGIGARTLEKYGRELAEMVSAYRREHAVAEVVPPAATSSGQGKALEEKPLKGNTRQVSFKLFQTGLSISQIAAERGLVDSTIEGHLASFIESGELAIGRLLAPDKQQTIMQKLAEMKDSTFTDIKVALGDGFSYGDIKMVQAHLRYLNKGPGV